MSLHSFTRGLNENDFAARKRKIVKGIKESECTPLGKAFTITLELQGRTSLFVDEKLHKKVLA